MIMWLISGQLMHVVAVNDTFNTASTIAKRLIHDKKYCRLYFKWQYLSNIISI